jgi:hypothetical protein
VTLDGRELESVDTVTHVLQAPPATITFSGRVRMDDCETLFPSVPEPRTIVWDKVMTSHPNVGRSAPIETGAVGQGA